MAMAFNFQHSPCNYGFHMCSTKLVHPCDFGVGLGLIPKGILSVLLTPELLCSDYMFSVSLASYDDQFYHDANGQQKTFSETEFASIVDSLLKGNVE